MLGCGCRPKKMTTRILLWRAALPKSVLPPSVKQREKRFISDDDDDNFVTVLYSTFVGPSVVMHLLFLVDLS